MKKILIIALIGITALACKKDDEITGTTNPTNPNDTTNNDTTIVLNGIEGRWTFNEEVQIYSEIGSSSTTGTGIPGFDTTIVYNTNETVITPAADLDGEGIEFLSNGTAYFFSEDGNEDTTTYTYSNSILELVIPEGSDNDTDTTFIIPVSNLTSNSADLLFYNISETIYEVDSSFGITVIDVTISSSLTYKLIK